MKLQVYILTYNRPDTFFRALESVEKQDYKDFEIVVSDNSSNTITKDRFFSSSHPHNVRYIKRTEVLRPVDHFNLCKNEVTADYYMLFHDDDTMIPGCLMQMMKVADAHPECICISGNAYKVDDDQVMIGPFRKVRRDYIEEDVKKLASDYLKGVGLPFPAHIYRKDAQLIPIDYNKGGKHSDTTYLVDLIKVAPFYMGFSIFALNYTTGSNQDSAVFNVSERRSLLKYIMEAAGLPKDDIAVMNYRLRNLYYFYSVEKRPVPKRIWGLYLKYNMPKLFFNTIIKSIVCSLNLLDKVRSFKLFKRNVYKKILQITGSNH